MKIVIDPGHGGKDPGAIGFSGTREAEINLAVARLLASELKGFDVAMTHTDERYVSITDRINFANSRKPDVFLSIHCNAVTDPGVRGVETFIVDLDSAFAPVAKDIQQRLVEATGFPDRGVKRANFAVLTKTKMSGALVELGFVSNQDEEAGLRDPNVRLSIARAMAAALREAAWANVVGWAKEAVGKAVSIGLVKNPELLTESEQKVIVWFDRLGLLEKELT